MMKAISQARSSFGMVSGAQDLAVALVLLLAVTLMILPLPTLLVDVIIGLNFGLAILLVMTALYLQTPLHFSTLPGVILIATILRLSLSVTTTRLILTDGDAGNIIQTFGEFVISGNVIVGMVVFFIITIVQLVVIAKGSERVAEVGARFTLDAMPGKQMSIDAELRNGDIDQIEARAQRVKLSRESQLFGAMDGAMKFVKGDAIAGIIIILINLIGGISVGILQQNMEFQEATQTYSLLTVGDALISQIPALLVSLAASIVVTRVASDVDNNLGKDISSQLARDHRALFLSGGLLFAIGMLPGFPAVITTAIAAIFFGLGILGRQRHLLPPAEADDAELDDPDGVSELEQKALDAKRELLGSKTSIPPRISIRLAKELVDDPRNPELMLHLQTARTEFQRHYGFEAPHIEIVDQSASEQKSEVFIDHVSEIAGHISPDTVWIEDDIRNLRLADIAYREVNDGPTAQINLAVTVNSEEIEKLAAAGIGFVTWDVVLTRLVVQAMKTRAAEFLGIQETRTLMEANEKKFTELMKEVLRMMTIQRIADVFKRMIEEEVSISNLRMILEVLAEWGEKERDIVMLVEHVRSGLKRQICHQYSDEHKNMRSLVMAKEVEEMVRNSLRETASGTYLMMDGAASERIIQSARYWLERNRELQKIEGVRQTQSLVLWTTVDVRRYIKNLFTKNKLPIAVLSYHELAADFTTTPIGTLSIASQPKKQADVPNT